LGDEVQRPLDPRFPRLYFCFSPVRFLFPPPPPPSFSSLSLSPPSICGSTHEYEICFPCLFLCHRWAPLFGLLAFPPTLLLVKHLTLKILHSHPHLLRCADAPSPFRTISDFFGRRFTFRLTVPCSPNTGALRPHSPVGLTTPVKGSRFLRLCSLFPQIFSSHPCFHSFCSYFEKMDVWVFRRFSLLGAFSFPLCSLLGNYSLSSFMSSHICIFETPIVRWASESRFPQLSAVSFFARVVYPPYVSSLAATTIEMAHFPPPP